MSDYLVHLPAQADHEVVLFQWSLQYGRCYECALPAAFWLPRAYRKDGEPDDVVRDATARCSVCAANAAVDGELVRRISDDADDETRNPYKVGRGGLS